MSSSKSHYFYVSSSCVRWRTGQETIFLFYLFLLAIGFSPVDNKELNPNPRMIGEHSMIMTSYTNSPRRRNVIYVIELTWVCSATAFSSSSSSSTLWLSSSFCWSVDVEGRLSWLDDAGSWLVCPALCPEGPFWSWSWLGWDGDPDCAIAGSAGRLCPAFWLAIWARIARSRYRSNLS